MAPDLLSIVSFDPFSAVGVDTVATNPISYAAINDDIFYSDGAKLMRLDSLGVANRVGVPSPVFSPAVQIAGDLQQATYLYTLTYFYGDEEGGAAPVKAIDAAAASRSPADAAGRHDAYRHLLHRPERRCSLAPQQGCGWYGFGLYHGGAGRRGVQD